MEHAMENDGGIKGGVGDMRRELTTLVADWRPGAA